MSSTQLQKPSKELLTSAILAATTYVKAHETLNYKGLRSALERTHPNWKLSDRRVTKYAKRMKKMQLKGTQPDAICASFDNDDEESISSSCYESEASSNIETSKTSAASSTKPKTTLKLNKSWKRFLNLKGGKENKSNKSNAVTPEEPKASIAPAAPSEPKKTNILPQLEDEFLSDSENDDVLSSAKTSPTASSPSSVPSFDTEHDVPALQKIVSDESKEETPQELLGYLQETEEPFQEAVREESVTLIGENLLAEEDFETNEIVAEDEGDNTTDKLDYSLYSDDNDGKKEGAICEGCIIL